GRLAGAVHPGGADVRQPAHPRGRQHAGPLAVGVRGAAGGRRHTVERGRHHTRSPHRADGRGGDRPAAPAGHGGCPRAV
ncbi:MAG: hypothetical protein AVDCRST_MAG77-1591, partial [uncultured Chloroflexi bacterium]